MGGGGGGEPVRSSTATPGHRDRTLVYSTVGTPDYIAPEVILVFVFSRCFNVAMVDGTGRTIFCRYIMLVSISILVWVLCVRWPTMEVSTMLSSVLCVFRAFPAIRCEDVCHMLSLLFISASLAPLWISTRRDVVVRLNLFDWINSIGLIRLDLFDRFGSCCGFIGASYVNMERAFQGLWRALNASRCSSRHLHPSYVDSEVRGQHQQFTNVTVFASCSPCGTPCVSSRFGVFGRAAAIPLLVCR